MTGPAPRRTGTQAVVMLAAAVLLTGCNALLAARRTAPPETPSTPQGRSTTRARSAPTAPPRAAVEPLAADPPEVEPQPAASDSAGISRLLRLAQLWHTVALHHPWVAERGVPWDSALIVATTRVRVAGSDDALESAYRKLLSVLRDPLTRIESASAVDAPAVAVSADRTTDSVLVVRIAPTAALNANDSAIVAQSLVGTVTRVLIDVRGAASNDPAAFADRLDDFLARTGVMEHLVTGEAAAPTVRTRRVGVWPSNEELFAANTFRDGWQLPADRVYRGHAVAPARIVILADSGSTLPRALLALQDAARASLVADGGLRDAAPVPRVRVPLDAHTVAVLRAGELVHVDGTLDVVPDTIVPHTPGATSDAAMQTALALLRGTARLPLADRPLPTYVAAARTPIFYDTTAYPFMGARLLGGFRLWSAMRARHAHRDLYDDDLDAVFERVVPRLEAATSAEAYAKAIGELAASLDDPAGAPVGSTYDAVIGEASLPFRVHSVEGRVFISDVQRDSVTARLALVPGTEILSLDGYPTVAWLSEHRRVLPASNEWTRLQSEMEQMTRGRANDAMLRVRDANNKERTLTVPRRVTYRAASPTVERPDGAISRTLGDGVTYIDVERLTDATIDATFSSLATPKGLVLDLRGQLHVDDARLLRRLATRPRAVTARVVQRTIVAPCLVTIREAAVECPDVRESRPWLRSIDTAAVVNVRIVALIDERTQGAMERFALSLEQMATVTFIGSASAGAVSQAVPLLLPGGLTVGIPPQEVRRADGSQVQRVGINPTIEARATLRGVRANDDEVITRAHQWLQQQLDTAPRRRR